MSVEAKLAMEHVRPEPPSTEELREQVDQRVQPKAQKPEPTQEDPRDQEAWTFSFEFTDKRGKLWAGSFTNKILDLGEQQAAAALQSRFTDGVPLESLYPDLRLLNRAVAHMVYSLTDAPTWAKDLRKLKDPAVVYALWKEVSSHEARYFRLEEAEEAGEGTA